MTADNQLERIIKALNDIEPLNVKTGYGLTPLGGIIMWSGLERNIPNGWHLCNGESVNGLTVPDLKNKFIIGAGDTYNPGDTGGASTVTLTTTELPSHTHTQNAHTHTQDAHTHTQNAHTHTQDAHHHNVPGSWDTANGANHGVTYLGSMLNGASSYDTTATNQNTTATNQNTTATNQNTTATNQNTGTGAAFDILNPYYALCFIMFVGY